LDWALTQLCWLERSHKIAAFGKQHNMVMWNNSKDVQGWLVYHKMGAGEGGEAGYKKKAPDTGVLHGNTKGML